MYIIATWPRFHESETHHPLSAKGIYFIYLTAYKVHDNVQFCTTSVAQLHPTYESTLSIPEVI